MSLFGDNMKELWACPLFQVLQGRNERFQIMAINRSDIIESEFLEKGCRSNQSFRMFLEPFGDFKHGTTQDGSSDIFGCGIEFSGHQPGEIAVQGADRRRYGHVVIIQNDKQSDIVIDTDIVHGLKCHSTCNGSVTDYCD